MDTLVASVPSIKNKLGQYFTPRSIADLMVSMSSAKPEDRVLEPCSGEGVFLDALRDAGYENLEAIEVDPALARSCGASVRNESFVSAEIDPGHRLVIGNPPYIRWRNLDDEAKVELAGNALWQTHFNSLCDYLCIFVARAVELLDDGGELVFVTPSFWMRTMHSQALREFMLSRGAVTDIIQFGEATVFPGVGSSILIFKFVKGSLPGPIRLVTYTGPRKVDLGGTTYSELLAGHEDFAIQIIPPLDHDAPWVLASEKVQARLLRFETACLRTPTAGAAKARELFPDGSAGVVRLGDIADIANGMVSGLDKAFRVPAGAALTAAEATATIEVAKGFSLEPYRVSETTKYIFLPLGLAERDFKAQYPNFADWLEPYRERLEQRYSYGRELPYWEWAFLRSIKFFSGATQLIYVPCKERLSNKTFLRFALGPKGSFPTQDVTALQLKPGIRESPLYLLALLNYPAMYDWVRFKGLMKGNVAEFSEKPLSQMPIRMIDWTDDWQRDQHDRIATLAADRVAGRAATNGLLEECVGQLLG